MAVQALVQDDAEALPVASCIVVALADHLGRHVLARAHARPRRAAVAAAVAPVEQGLVAERRGRRRRGRGRLHLRPRRQLALVLLHRLRHALLPLHPALEALGAVGRVALDREPELLQQAVPLRVVVARVVGPVPVEGQPEVRDLQVARGRDEEVVRLHVAVDAAQRVRLLDAEYHLGDVELGHRLAEDVLADQEPEEVAPGHVVHDEVEVPGVLKARDERDDPACSSQLAFANDKEGGELDDWWVIGLTISSLRTQRGSPSRPVGGLLDWSSTWPICESPSLHTPDCSAGNRPFRASRARA